MNKVVNLSSCRDLLARWMGIRDRITTGASGFMVCVRNPDGTETIEVGGCYASSADDALKASMRMSWAATSRSGVLPP